MSYDDESNPLLDRVLYFLTGALVSSVAYMGIQFSSHPVKVPNTDNVQAGYLAPSKIEKIACEDLDNNGENETTIKIDGKKFLLKYDHNGKPSIVEYEVTVKEK